MSTSHAIAVSPFFSSTVLTRLIWATCLAAALLAFALQAKTHRHVALLMLLPCVGLPGASLMVRSASPRFRRASGVSRLRGRSVAGKAPRASTPSPQLQPPPLPRSSALKPPPLPSNPEAKAEQVKALVDMVESFVYRSQQPTLTLSLNNSIGARALLERLPQNMVALELVGERGLPTAEMVSWVRDEMAARRLPLGVLSVS